ncbi:MAG: methylmalonyl Co-A mutase-associated GTPase MeaB, partial [Verrucomicrobiae bacterium]|nr:methylmalonyl Co-A mutase-associated GTPase MeaB [Verrucomicrobiae bacterium]
MEQEDRPDWVPENASDAFTSHIMKGVKDVSRQNPDDPGGPRRRLRDLSPEEYVDGTLEGNRTILAKAITLIESNAPHHQSLAQDVLNRLLPHSGKSIRVGITGVPGVGKSTFIETLGMMLCNAGKKVAVLAIDPSSTLTRGSILGDKTRMENLARHPNAFIRPSPSSGTLGGVANKSRETMLLCEAFGFDTLLIETVGVGQSETTVRSLVDFFMLLMLPGAGDELQGIKKGVVETADGLVVNKCDGDFKEKARRACSQYANILQYFTPASEGWQPQVMTCSASEGNGIKEAWDMVMDFIETTKASGVFEKRRREQSVAW